jgi:dTMP kinase
MISRTMKARGLLIVFEGLDRSGKSTQANLLNERMNADGHKSEYWKYPKRDTELGSVINKYLNKEIELNDQAIHLLFSANRWETVSTMENKLKTGINLIVDRYAYSGVAYSAAKPSMDFDWCKQCDTGLPKPDVIYFMDTKQTNIDQREGFGTERYEKTEFQKIVYDNFKKLLGLGINSNSQSDCIPIDANRSIASIHDEIYFNVLKLKEDKSNDCKLKKLW